MEARASAPVLIARVQLEQDWGAGILGARTGEDARASIG
jgi:hypothetical protein